MQLRGCGTALVTPFHRDGSLDLKKLAELVEWQINCGLNFLVACGTTGETPTLEEEEWLDVIRVTVETANRRVPVFAGCTHNSTREAVRKAIKVAEIPGVHGLLTASPYYNKPSQEGQFQHFQVMAASMPLPLLLYNIPGRTGVNLEPKTIQRLVESIPTIAGIKESSGDLEQITELIHLLPRNIPVYAGDDGLALAALGVGAAGLISVASNIIPREMRKMVASAIADDWDTARQLNQRYYELMQANFWEPSPGPVKCLLSMMGKIEEAYRLPITPVSSTNRKRLQKLATFLKLIV